MGKASGQRLPVVRQQQEAADGGRWICCHRCSSAIARELSFKCVFFLILTVVVFLFTLSSVVHIRSRNIAYDAEDSVKTSATIQAHFVLLKSVSQLVHHISELEYDISGEIGVPSTKVVILSLHPANVTKITNVVFGVLSDLPNKPIDPAYSSLLKSTCIELFLRQANLTLTNRTFGHPSSFEILKFPGGITLIPEQSSSVSYIPEILFNFSLNNSAQEIRDNFDELKRQLRSGLDLRPNENIYIQVRNEKGSTIDPPILVEASVTTDYASLLPQRQRELAAIILASHGKNLGLNKLQFGKVNEVKLSSHGWDLSPSSSPSQSPSPSPSPSPLPCPSSFPSPLPSPSLSPSPLPSPSPSPSPSLSPTPAPCPDCEISAPSDPSKAYPPANQDHSCLPLVPSPPPDFDSDPPSSAPHPSPIPVISYGCNDGCGKLNNKIVKSPPYALPLSSSSSSRFAVGKIWWLSLVGLFATHLLCDIF